MKDRASSRNSVGGNAVLAPILFWTLMSRLDVIRWQDFFSDKRPSFVVYATSATHTGHVALYAGQMHVR